MKAVLCYLSQLASKEYEEGREDGQVTSEEDEDRPSQSFVFCQCPNSIIYSSLTALPRLPEAWAHGAHMGHEL